MNHDPGAYAQDPLFQSARDWAATTHTDRLHLDRPTPTVAQLALTLSRGSRMFRELGNDFDDINRVLDKEGVRGSFDRLRQELVGVLEQTGPDAPYFKESTSTTPARRRAFAAAVVAMLEVRGAEAERDLPEYRLSHEEHAALIAAGPGNEQNKDMLTRVRSELVGLNMTQVGSDVDKLAQGVVAAAGLGQRRSAEPDL